MFKRLIAGGFNVSIPLTLGHETNGGIHAVYDSSGIEHTWYPKGILTTLKP
jgi:hypothetical protein